MLSTRGEPIINDGKHDREKIHDATGMRGGRMAVKRANAVARGRVESLTRRIGPRRGTALGARGILEGGAARELKQK
jgi:hypothetical protein